MSRTDVMTAVVVSALAVVGGWCLWSMIDVPGVTVDREVNPLHAVSMLFTTIVAVVFGVWIKRRDDGVARLREVLVERLGDVDASAADICVAARDNGVRVASAPSLTKRLHRALKAVCDVAVSAGILRDDPMRKLEDHTRRLNDLLTSTAIRESGDGREPEGRAVEGGMVYTETRISDISTTVEELREELLRLQVRILKGTR